MKAPRRWGIFGRFSLSLLLVAIGIQVAIIPGTGAAPTIIDEVRDSFNSGSDARAITLLNSYRASRGVTPEYLEAFSWLARAELVSRNYAPAEKFAQTIYSLATAELKKRPLDSEPHLPIALGAAIEIQGDLLTAQGRRSEAVTYLTTQAQTFAATSIVVRIRKNLLELTLEGKPAPALDGIVLPKGKPVLLFFWAHWCPDCKAEAPILSRIKFEFASKGLVMIAPTQKYGYVAGGADATPAVETAYIEQVRSKYYAGLIEPLAPMGSTPVKEINFTRYGASTTPTLVLIDREGLVRLYHPGAMTYPELREAVRRVTEVPPSVLRLPTPGSSTPSAGTRP